METALVRPTMSLTHLSSCHHPRKWADTVKGTQGAGEALMEGVGWPTFNFLPMTGSLSPWGTGSKLPEQTQP